MSEPCTGSVFHPTDLSEASATAFAHALAIGLARRTRLTVLNVAPGDAALNDWGGFPGVREYLERWGLLEAGAPRSAVDDLGISVKKVSVRDRDTAAAITRYLARHPADLIVLSTGGRTGLPSWLRPSMAERLARSAGIRTLFVPNGCTGFVSAESGATALDRILVPVAHDPDGGVAASYVANLAASLGVARFEVLFLHVGSAGAPRPAIEMPSVDGCRASWSVRGGPVVDVIVEAAREIEASLIAMATAGRNGWVDEVRGSVTEQVLRRSGCPVLAVPA